MDEDGRFDTTFNFRTEAGGGDADETSSTLREYHKRPWSKPLPSGLMFELEVITTYRSFLHHLSSRGEFYLTSDSAMQTWTGSGWQTRMGRITAQVGDAELEEFLTVAHQIGRQGAVPGDAD